MKKLDLDFMGRIRKNLQRYKGGLGRSPRAIDVPFTDKRLIPPIPLTPSPPIPFGMFSGEPGFGKKGAGGAGGAEGPPCPDFSWNEERSASTIGHSDSVNVYVVGGRSPYSWFVSPSGFSLANAQTSGLGNVLTADGQCDSATVVVRDSCGQQCSKVIAIDIDTFEYDPNNPSTIAESEEKTITVIGGASSFTWAVTGTGFSFAEEETGGRTNTLIASGTTCDDAVITITDSCAVEVGDTITLTIPVFTYDSGNPTVIASGEEDGIVITVTGGGGPFTWATSAGCTYFDEAVTEGRTNLLKSCPCAPGGTGNITVTAACGDPLEVSGGMESLAGDAGGWVEIYDCQVGTTGWGTCEYTAGKYKWKYSGMWGGGGITCAVCDEKWREEGYSCGELSCIDNAVYRLDIRTKAIHLWQWEWKCAA